jgi:hypothetical protein
LSGEGRDKLRLNNKLAKAKCLDDLHSVYVLNENKKSNSQYYMVILFYLKRKGLLLMPLCWPDALKVIPINSGLYFDSINSWFPISEIKSDKNKKYSNDFRTVGYLRRILLSAGWNKISDILDDDLDKMVIKIQKDLINFSGRSNYNEAINHIVQVCNENGNSVIIKADLYVLRKGENNFHYKGLKDGTFAYLKAYEEKNNSIVYWANHARELNQREIENGRQGIGSFNKSIKSFLDYLCYLLDNGNENQIPSSIGNINRELHIKRIPKTKRKKENDALSYLDWIWAVRYPYDRENQKKFASVRHTAVSSVRMFFQFISEEEDLTNFKNPINRSEIPSKPKQKFKSSRPSITLDQFNDISELLDKRPPKLYEYVRIKDENGNRKLVKKESPILRCYTICRLYLAIRDEQCRYLDKDKILGKNGYIISGDKNIHRDYLIEIPYFDDEIPKKYIQECIEWQNKYNTPSEPVPYGDKQNSPFGKVSPLFRKINLNPRPISRKISESYLKKVFLKYQIEKEIEGYRQFIRDVNNEPFPIETLREMDVDKINVKQLKKFMTTYDPHSLRIISATMWYEAGLSINIIKDFITGHATIEMLLHYIKIENAGKILEKAYQSMQTKRLDIERGFKSGDYEKVIEKYQLISRPLRAEDIEREIDGVQTLINEGGPFWKEVECGYCPVNACPHGVDGRCAICPLLITGPAFNIAIDCAYSRTIEEGVIVGVHIRECGENSSFKARIESISQEVAGWYSWKKILKEKELEGSIGNDQLLSRTDYDTSLERVDPYVSQWWRCKQVQHVPEFYTINIENFARNFLMMIVSKISPDVNPYEIVNRLSGREAISKVGNLFETAGQTFDNYSEMGELLRKFIEDSSDEFLVRLNEKATIDYQSKKSKPK